MSAPPDEELARRLRSRDPAERDAAFSLLFERHQRAAFELAWRVLGDAGLAADAVQEAFLRVYRKGARFEARAKFSSWLHRVVLNLSIDLQRRTRRQRALSLGDGCRATEDRGIDSPGADVSAEPASEAPSPERVAVDTERHALVRAAVARLSPKLAKVVLLRYPQGLSYEEIGAVLGVPPGTVRSRLNRAHATLRDILGDALDDA